MRHLVSIGLSAILAAVATAPSALAGVTIAVVAHRDSPVPGQTQFEKEVCVCFGGVDWVAWVDGGFRIRIEMGASQVTENDFWDDDELDAVTSGTWTITMPAGNYCPPAAPVCQTFGGLFPPGGVPSGSYESENPGDFQLGTNGGEEGTVPPGTTVKFGPGFSHSTTPSYPNRTS